MTAAAPPPTERAARRQRKWLRRLLAILAVLCAARALLVPYRVSGPSMEPAFRGGPDGADIVLVWRPAYWTRSPRRGEVVVYSRVPGEPAGVKRVAGLPGETVEIRGGSLWIDGTRTVFTLPHARSVVRKGPYGHRSVRLGANEYFVLGDRSYLSRDSRHWGPLRREAILGRAILVVWPWSRSGWIE